MPYPPTETRGGGAAPVVWLELMAYERSMAWTPRAAVATPRRANGG